MGGQTKGDAIEHSETQHSMEKEKERCSLELEQKKRE